MMSAVIQRIMRGVHLSTYFNTQLTSCARSTSESPMYHVSLHTCGATAIPRATKNGRV